MPEKVFVFISPSPECLLSAHPHLTAMRTIDPENPLASNCDLLEDDLKVLKEVEGPTEPLRELLEGLGGLKGSSTLKDCEDDIRDAKGGKMTPIGVKVSMTRQGADHV
jgi:hypothetical protein